MNSWILTDGTNELIVRCNIGHARHTEILNPSFDIPQQIKGRNTAAENPIIPTNEDDLSPNVKIIPSILMKDNMSHQHIKKPIINPDIVID